MKDIIVSEDIVPLGEFKAQASRLLAQLGSDHHPLVITQNGRPAGVLLAPADYDQICEQQRFLKSIASGIADAQGGRVMETSELRQRLAERRGMAKDE
ncbi:MAG: type II toxin-antitoxin system Phd/YefM family antitoxin [Gammaproteobacteria bacterium]|nr:type II toxin-antitoxin system Phd/YefM family antitoxin [Gammaproteobacteria bacterium]